MILTVKKLHSAINRGGVWILMTNKAEMEGIIHKTEIDNNSIIHVMQIETIEDVVKTSILIKAFNIWTMKEIREFMKYHRDNFSEIDEL